MIAINKEIRDIKKFMELIRRNNAFDKVCKVIESCKSAEHLQTASKLVQNYERLYGTSNHLIDLFFNKSLKLLK